MGPLNHHQKGVTWGARIPPCSRAVFKPSSMCRPDAGLEEHRVDSSYPQGDREGGRGLKNIQMTRPGCRQTPAPLPLTLLCYIQHIAAYYMYGRLAAVCQHWLSPGDKMYVCMYVLLPPPSLRMCMKAHEPSMGTPAKRVQPFLGRTKLRFAVCKGVCAVTARSVASCPGTLDKRLSLVGLSQFSQLANNEE